MSVAPWLLWPAGFPLLFLIPVAWLFLQRLDLWRRRRLRRQLGPRCDSLTLDGRLSRSRRQRPLVAAGGMLAVVAVLQPLVGVEQLASAPGGIDVVVCLDVSRSMLARDLAPSRLERAREELRVLAERVAGQRIALVAFAGEARLVVPLTRDTAAFAELLADVDPWTVQRGGTDLGAALRRGLEALAGSDRRRGVLLLLSDGEDLEGRGATLAESCREQQVPVHCVAFGSARGSKIPLPGEAGFLRDRDGHEVISVMDPAGLQNVAAIAGGQFVDAGPAVEPLASLFEAHVAPLLDEPLPGPIQSRPMNRYQWPLAAAFLLWILELSWTPARRG